MTTAKPAPRARYAPWRLAAQLIARAATVVLGARGPAAPGAPSVEAYCPLGAVETAWAALTRGEFLRHLAPSNGVVFGVVALSAVLLGRVFCGWVCPLGALQDWLAWLSRRLMGAGPNPWRLPRWADRVLRGAKGRLLGWRRGARGTAGAPPLAPLCPFRSLFEFRWDALLTWGVIGVFVAVALMIERAWCRYFCPLGAILSLFNRLSPLRPRVNAERCVACGRCAIICPVEIDPVADGTQHPECVRCYACADACKRDGALTVR